MAAIISPIDDSATSQRYAAVDHSLPKWKQKLIDGSRRNNLLFYRTNKSGTLDLSQTRDEVLAEILAGKSVRFSRIFMGSDDPKLNTNARNIASKAMENLEEKGLTTLYLTFGIATWPAADGGRPYEAPIVLLPIKFENSGRDQALLSIQRTGDMQFNLTLAHVLFDMYALTIDSAMMLQEQDSVNQATWPEIVFTRLSELANDIKDFRIENRRYISNFSFQKLAMVQDLEENVELLAHHPIVAAIAGDAQAQALVRAGRREIDPRSFDRQPISQEYLILDADSSQQKVIASVLAGQNGVIQGPPGTGKSQTIANLIAVCVAHGKRVLFVAEKRAALEVVLRRLEQHHLGHIALDLHGADISRRDILRRVGQSLDMIRDVQPVKADALHHSLEERRRQLDQHDLRLHEPIDPANLSPFELRGRILHLKRQIHSTVRWRGARLGKITTVQASTIHDLLHEASEHADLAHGTSSSPWLGAKFGPGQAQASMQIVDWIATTLPMFWQNLCQEVTQLGLDAPATIAALQRYRDIHQRIQTLLERYPAELFTADVPAITDTLMVGARSHVTSLWQIVINPRYRQAFLQVRSLRGDRRISPWTAINEIQEAYGIHNSWKALGETNSLPQRLTTLDDAYLNTLFSHVVTVGAIIGRTDLAKLPIADLQDLVQGLAADVATPFRIDRLAEIERILTKLGVAEIYREICEQRLTANRWTEAFDYAWYQSCLDDSYLKFPELAHFTGRHHDTIVQEFRDQDKHHIKTNAALIAQRHAEKAIQAMHDFPMQQSIVQREAKKKARHMPLRKLLAEAPDVLTTLFPCWMASPLAVSQLIGADRRYFDIVIFDEASQVLPEDAIPSILRGTQLVVAGDKHQLPPTTFFADATMDDEETDTPDTMEGLESLLDLVSVTFAPDWYLEWHYRSRDESLIAFSNRHIYHNRLVTFPGSGGPSAIRFIESPWISGLDGQEESASAEVIKVVELIIEHACASPDKSLGVITMGVKHAKHIEAQLNDVRRQRNDIADTFFDASRQDRFFIKSIEQVQGDERDAIILSIGYGKDRSGKLKYTFGPINKEGGERRLNVAVTRARVQMTIVASFSHRDMDPERSKSQGVKFLRDYLQFAQSEGRLLGDAGLSNIPLNPFEADIFDTLREHGLDMMPQWGVSSYRIDLAVKHPTQPGRFVLAIECDGATYHSAATARDRDRLRQQHLESLGWRFHRIWSTDWFFRREEEIKRTLDAYQKAVKLSDIL